MENLPIPEIFVNEDLSKPENRTNLALFGLMLVPAIRAWLLEKLSLPADCVIYPPQNIVGGRPDFVVIGPQQNVVAWVEVELGGENLAQLARYRARYTEPVKSIVGPVGVGGDLSLEEIAGALGGPTFQNFDRQQTVNLGVFTALVSSMAGKVVSFNYVDPAEQVREQVVVRALRERLGSMLQFGVPPVTPGTTQISTITQKGWTLKVYSKVATSRTASLLWNQGSGKNEVRVSSLTRLKRCFPTATSQVEQFAAVCKDLGADVSSLAEGQSLAMSEHGVLAEMDRLAAAVRALATIYGTTA